MTFYNAIHVYLIMYVTVVSATRVRDCCLYNLRMPPKNVKKNTYFEIQVVWVVMQLTPSIVTTLSSTLYSLRI